MQISFDTNSGKIGYTVWHVHFEVKLERVSIITDFPNSYHALIGDFLNAFQPADFAGTHPFSVFLTGDLTRQSTPAMLQRMIQWVLRELPFSLVYIDDVLVGTEPLGENPVEDEPTGSTKERI